LSRFSSSSSRSRMIVGGHESLLCSSLYGIANLDSVVFNVCSLEARLAAGLYDVREWERGILLTNE
jgi:hypothetical protein